MEHGLELDHQHPVTYDLLIFYPFCIGHVSEPPSFPTGYPFVHVLQHVTVSVAGIIAFTVLVLFVSNFITMKTGTSISR